MQRTRIALASVVLLATSCSLVTSLDGLSGGATGAALDDAGPGMTSDAPSADGPSSTADAGSNTPRAWRQIAISGPPAMHSARMAFDEARGRSVLFGGDDQPTSNEVYEWDGATWNRPAAMTKPTARKAPGLAYDSARHVTVLFAGTAGTPDPWEWDGTTWKSSGTSPSSPDVRAGAAMTYDRKRNVLVVYGGLTMGSAATSVDNVETWEWSSATGFVKRTPVRSPPGRHANVLVYDESRERVVAFGGSDGSVRGDLWEWDGSTWTELTPLLSPSARRAACAAYDSVRKVTVLFGGRPEAANTALADTWEWDGQAWKAGAAGPPGRASCAMTFDKVRNQIVMFGGSTRHPSNKNPEVLADTWVYE